MDLNICDECASIIPLRGIFANNSLCSLCSRAYQCISWKHEGQTVRTSICPNCSTLRQKCQLCMSDLITPHAMGREQPLQGEQRLVRGEDKANPISGTQQIEQNAGIQTFATQIDGKSPLERSQLGQRQIKVSRKHNVNRHRRGVDSISADQSFLEEILKPLKDRITAVVLNCPSSECGITSDITRANGGVVLWVSRADELILVEVPKESFLQFAHQLQLRGMRVDVDEQKYE